MVPKSAVGFTLLFLWAAALASHLSAEACVLKLNFSLPGCPRRIVKEVIADNLIGGRVEPSVQVCALGILPIIA